MGYTLEMLPVGAFEESGWTSRGPVISQIDGHEWKVIFAKGDGILQRTYDLLECKAGGRYAFRLNCYNQKGLSKVPVTMVAQAGPPLPPVKCHPPNLTSMTKPRSATLQWKHLTNMRTEVFGAPLTKHTVSMGVSTLDDDKIKWFAKVWEVPIEVGLTLILTLTLRCGRFLSK